MKEHLGSAERQYTSFTQIHSVGSDSRSASASFIKLTHELRQIELLINTFRQQTSSHQLSEHVFVFNLKQLIGKLYQFVVKYAGQHFHLLMSKYKLKVKQLLGQLERLDPGRKYEIFQTRLYTLQNLWPLLTNFYKQRIANLYNLYRLNLRHEQYQKKNEHYEQAIAEIGRVVKEIQRSKKIVRATKIASAAVAGVAILVNLLACILSFGTLMAANISIGLIIPGLVIMSEGFIGAALGTVSFAFSVRDIRALTKELKKTESQLIGSLQHENSLKGINCVTEKTLSDILLKIQQAKEQLVKEMADNNALKKTIENNKLTQQSALAKIDDEIRAVMEALKVGSDENHHMPEQLQMSHVEHFFLETNEMKDVRKPTDNGMIEFEKTQPTILSESDIKSDDLVQMAY